MSESLNPDDQNEEMQEISSTSSKPASGKNLRALKALKFQFQKENRSFVQASPRNSDTNSRSESSGTLLAVNQIAFEDVSLEERTIEESKRFLSYPTDKSYQYWLTILYFGIVPVISFITPLQIAFKL